MTMNQANAEKYVAEVGMTEAKRSTHYLTGKSCNCGSCFCCEVVKATDERGKWIVSEGPAWQQWQR